MSERISNWQLLFYRVNSLGLNSDLKKHIPETMLTAGWCGAPAASTQNIVDAERRLGLELPPSYKSFLQIANGWSGFSTFVHQLWSTEEINWLHLADPELLAAIQEYYAEDTVSDEEYLDYGRNSHLIRPRYYGSCILVGQGASDELVLLNSEVISPDLEWETIFFANWNPGNQRYRSFWEFCEETARVEEMIQNDKRTPS